VKDTLIQKNVVVRKSSLHGYGVFATKTIRKGQVIEECYVILTRGGDKGLEDFYFDAKKKNAVILGFGSIYNHSDEPNADYKINMKRRVATFVATKTIQKGEEIFVSYGDEWFSDRGLTAK
jgi:SET domain-containing protein